MNRTVSALRLFGEPVPSDRFPNRRDLYQAAYAAQLDAFRAGPITFNLGLRSYWVWDGRPSFLSPAGRGTVAGDKLVGPPNACVRVAEQDEIITNCGEAE